MNKPISVWERLWSKEIQAVFDAVHTGKTWMGIGIYGSGKIELANLLFDILSVDHAVIRISFRSTSTPAVQDFYRLAHEAVITSFPEFSSYPIPTNDFSLHYLFADVLKKHPTRQVAIIIDETQKALTFPESIFDALESLRYMSIPRLSIVLFAQPQARFSTNQGFVRLSKGNWDILPLYSYDQINEFVHERYPELAAAGSIRLLQTMTHGHHGAIKYIGQQIRAVGGALRNKRLQEWERTDPMFSYFIRTVFDSLSDCEQLILRQYLTAGTIAPVDVRSDAFRQLVSLHLLWPNTKRGIGFLMDGYREIGKTMVDHVFSITPLDSGEDMRQFEKSLNYQERTVVYGLQKQHATVSLDEIGEWLWPDDDGTKYSVWSVQQIIARIRRKLLRVGLSPQIIRNVRRVGYEWTDIRR
jgi:hypothetical protein